MPAVAGTDHALSLWSDSAWRTLCQIQDGMHGQDPDLCSPLSQATVQL